MLYVVDVCIVNMIAGYNYLVFMEQFYGSGKPLT